MLEENLRTPKKWSLIANKFYGRTEHSIKNRFISLIGKKFQLKRPRTLDLIKGNDLKSNIEKTLNLLNGKRKIMDESIIIPTIENFMESDIPKKQRHLDDSFEEALEILFCEKRQKKKIIRPQKL